MHFFMSVFLSSTIFGGPSALLLVSVALPSLLQTGIPHVSGRTPELFPVWGYFLLKKTAMKALVTSLFVYILSFLLGKYLEVKFEGHMEETNH